MTKKIHYVWLGGNPLPPSTKACIESWKRYCPAWEIISWDESNFDVGAYRWVREALEAKRWAFASDFIRMAVLLKHGGVYMDTDVQLYAPLEPVITNRMVAGVLNHYIGTDKLENVTEDGYMKDTHEPCTGFAAQGGFLYAEPGHPFIKEFIERYYDGGQRPFAKDGGGDNSFVIDDAIYRLLCEHGAVYRDKDQLLPCGITIYDSHVLPLGCHATNAQWQSIGSTKVG